MIVRKIIERVLTVGQTSIVITDTDIPYSLIRVYSNDPDLMPVQRVLTGNTLKIDYEAQTSEKYVAVELVKQGLEIIDSLESTDANSALSANQGKVLKELIDSLTPIRELVELDDVSADNPQAGDILMYNSTTEKWTKYNLPDIPSYLEQLGDVVIDSVANGQVLTFNGAYWTNETPSSGINYTTTETVIGSWNSDILYRKIFEYSGSGIACNPNTWTKLSFITGVNKVKDARAFDSNGTLFLGMWGIVDGDVAFYNLRSTAVTLDNNSEVMIEYTKSV